MARAHDAPDFAERRITDVQLALPEATEKLTWEETETFRALARRRVLEGEDLREHYLGMAEETAASKLAGAAGRELQHHVRNQPEGDPPR